jgi:isopentenyl phosphate kinase
MNDPTYVLKLQQLARELEAQRIAFLADVQGALSDPESKKSPAVCIDGLIKAVLTHSQTVERLAQPYLP